MFYNAVCIIVGLSELFLWCSGESHARMINSLALSFLLLLQKLFYEHSLGAKLALRFDNAAVAHIRALVRTRNTPCTAAV